MTKAELQTAAAAEGFARCRVAAPGPAPHGGALREWIAEGSHATMEWMARTAEDRTHPERVLPGVQSIVVLATSYAHENRPPASGDSARGRIARYAWSDDYHEVIAPRLQALDALMTAAGGRQRCFTDSGPVMERDWAAASGVSWHGKSTMGIHPEMGTWFFLSVILSTLPFAPDDPLPDRCGRCTRCLEACPTAAITAPYHLDANRCLSFLTIENKGPIPEEFRVALGDRIFGCDDCLDACPWNRFARASRDAALAPREDILATPLRDFLTLDEAEFKSRFRGSPILRAKRRGFLRNVCVALGNTGSAEDLPALRRALEDAEPLVREHAAWAIARLQARG